MTGLDPAIAWLEQQADHLAHQLADGQAESSVPTYLAYPALEEVEHRG